MKKHVVLFVLFISMSSYSQNIYQTIRGKVIDKDSKQTLPRATVILQNFEPVIGVTTDADGEFIIKNSPIGRQSITISFVGYHSTEVKNLLLQSGKEIAEH